MLKKKGEKGLTLFSTVEKKEGTQMEEGKIFLGTLLVGDLQKGVILVKWRGKGGDYLINFEGEKDIIRCPRKEEGRNFYNSRLTP